MSCWDFFVIGGTNCMHSCRSRILFFIRINRTDPLHAGCILCVNVVNGLHLDFDRILCIHSCCHSTITLPAWLLFLVLCLDHMFIHACWGLRSKFRRSIEFFLVSTRHLFKNHCFLKLCVGFSGKLCCLCRFFFESFGSCGYLSK